MENETLIALASDIVSAHVSNNQIDPADLPKLIVSTYNALAGLGHAEAEVETKREPAVSIRASVKLDSVTCLECGFKGKMLKRHLNSEHCLSPVEYRARWNLAADHPLVAPAYAQQRKELAKTIGLGRKPGSGKAAQKVKTPRKGKAAKKD